MSNYDDREGYDIFGDIHSHGDELVSLLQELGYSHDGVSYIHPCRQALFLGDFVDPAAWRDGLVFEGQTTFY
ncbi:MAG: hypothetical protein P8Y92_06095 [Halioglobus sp.]|jgi:hypothetical protein